MPKLDKDSAIRARNTSVVNTITDTFWNVVHFFRFFVQTLIWPQSADNIRSAELSGGGRIRVIRPNIQHFEGAPPCGEAGGPLIEAVAGFVPIAGPLLSVIIRQIFDLTEKAEHNKKICRRLAERVRVASLNLERQHERPDDVALNQYKDAIFECKNFIEKISKTSTFMKFITGKDVEWQFNEINRNLDSAIGQLGLEEIMRTREEIEEDGTLLRSEMRSTLGVIEEVMKNVFKEGMDTKKKVEVLDSKIDAMHNAVNNLSSGLQIPKNLGLTRIECKHIVEIDGGDNDDNNEIKNQSQFIGSIGQVRKMRYITQIVSEKEIGPINSLSRPLETIEKEVAILTELKDCEYIIRFYGTMQRAGKLYIISEWADSGDLNTYLKGNPNLPWSFKIKIATEIASGLVFCHTFDILHHDIRSHNILLTDKLSAKLSNFSSSRKETDNTSQVNDIHSIYRWLAPEKVLHYRENSYTKQCDIYSFAIVLWELASQELPYGEITKPNKLIETIKSGQRPRLIPGTPPIFERIMQQGWHQRPIKRPTASYMFKELNGINRPCGEPESIRPLST
ncbi:hypothetical protein G9A89_005104 [Geosiphon pyriformis]|nr:hypothetical protein G9A89_005104 [Geosiphon pyriformis]